MTLGIGCQTREFSPENHESEFAPNSAWGTMDWYENVGDSILFYSRFF